MGKNKFIKPKPLRDIDSVSVSLFLKGLMWPLVFLCLLGFIWGSASGGVLGAVIGLVAGAIVSVLVSLLAMVISDKFGGLFLFIYKGPKANWSVEEQLEGDLSQVRYHKMNKRFDLALIKVDEVLAKAPTYLDALYLKASILWEGVDMPIEAKRYLATIMKKASKTDNHHTWASTLYADIVKEEKKRLNDERDEKI
jgi:hypothetical protein